MPTDTSSSTGALEDLAAAARQQEAPEPLRIMPRRCKQRVPRRQMLTAGGFVLRGLGAFLLIMGCWGVLWGVIEGFLLWSGPRNATQVSISDGRTWIQLQGWPAIIFCLIWTAVWWCAAIVAFALGHAFYAIRNLAFAEKR